MGNIFSLACGKLDVELIYAWIRNNSIPVL